ncbi:MAG: NADH-quinone oxidoreductase subunit J [Verrucomicrobiae bacterium]|nr:NADH-quinone oxidoreductase subunit J [Verrucomicrobiae bacterium]
MTAALFYIMGLAMLGFGVAVITSRNPVNSAMSLVLLLAAMSGLFVLLGAFFLAAVQVLVYAGAIMVVFLFVIMFLGPDEGVRRRLHWFGAINGLLVVVALLYAFFTLAGKQPPMIGAEGRAGTVESLGRLLFSKYLLPFEVASVLLLVAIVGAVVLARKDARSS